MAEDQDQKKPKTTLIKHRKEEHPTPSDDADRKKVRVVVRRKTKAKTPEKKPAKTPATDKPTSKAETSRHQKEVDAVAKEKPSDAAAPTPPSVERTVVQTEERVTLKVPTENRPPDSGQRPTQTNPFTVRDFKEPPPSVRESVRFGRGTGQPGARSGQSGAGSAPPARGRAGDRPQRPRTGTSGPPQRGGFRPARPSTPRPSGGQRDSGPPPADEKKGGKKAYKTKRRDAYPRRERHQEKEIQLKQKKAVPKANPVPKQIDIMEVITVSELARKMNLKASDLIGKLMSMGMMVTINQQIDAETATILADEYGCKVNIVSLYDETIIETEQDKDGDLLSRPPVVTVMGHVDHGKTKLLDTIRSANVVDGEFGGITQHIGAYQVITDHGPITFLDTPGHEAFTMMRARGAQITDIVILVVAADDGVMPQTREAVDHARAAGVPIVVAINKMDLAGANPDRVKQQLSDLELIPEDWGGNTLFVPVSALKGDGVAQLLETIALQAELLELKANYDANAEGTVVESRIDPGRGTVSTVLIQRGTLKVGSSFVAGIYPGRVRTMFNDRGDRITEAGPSVPVEILGFTGIPEAGDPFQETESEKIARQVGDKRQELKKVEEAGNVKKITLDNLYDSIQDGAVDELKVVIKGDVHGSVEALQSSLEKLSTSEIRLAVISAAAGAINESDVALAAASDAIIIGFHVRPTPRAQAVAEQEKVEIRKYNIIYDVVEDVRSAMEGMLSPDIQEKTIGQLEVRDTFKVPRIGLIAGCYVTTGLVRRNASANVVRDGVIIYTGKISSLKRFKDDAREVETGYECGVGVENFNDIKVGDQLEIFEVREVAKTLGAAVTNG